MANKAAAGAGPESGAEASREQPWRSEMTKQFCMGISCLTYEIFYANSPATFGCVRRHNKTSRSERNTTKFEYTLMERENARKIYLNAF